MVKSKPLPILDLLVDINYYSKEKLKMFVKTMFCSKSFLLNFLITSVYQFSCFDSIDLTVLYGRQQKTEHIRKHKT